MSAFSPIPLRLAVIDYGMGNLRSVCRAFEHVGANVSLVSHPDEVGDADALVFPGQGAIVDTMVQLQQTGFDDCLRTWIAADKPFFGICLGLQALFEHSQEGDTACLGIFPGRVKRFIADEGHKVPHMGWNQAAFRGDADAMLSGLHASEDQFYFVHSYYVDCRDEGLVWAYTDYKEKFVSAIRRGNIFATQFHPEKSQSKGLQIYRNFVEWSFAQK